MQYMHDMVLPVKSTPPRAKRSPASLLSGTTVWAVVTSVVLVVVLVAVVGLCDIVQGRQTEKHTYINLCALEAETCYMLCICCSKRFHFR